MTDTTTIIQRAVEEISALCHGRHWTMCVPVQDSDSDQVFMDLVRAARRLHANLDAAQSSLRAISDAAFELANTLGMDNTHQPVFVLDVIAAAQERIAALEAALVPFADKYNPDKVNDPYANVDYKHAYEALRK